MSRIAHAIMGPRQLALLLALFIAACTRATPRGGAETGPSASPPTLEQAVLPAGDTEAARAMRNALVSSVAANVHVKNERVLEAMRRVPRHLFVPDAPLDEAYGDWPTSIGHGQTISQPSVVAEMTDALELRGPERVLEIGTGSGYQAAVLAQIAREVYTIEIVPELGRAAETRLRDLGYANVHVRIGDGYAGWPEAAPFDRIILTAAPPKVPKALTDQLAEGGVLVAPVGEEGATQQLVRIRKQNGQLRRESLSPVRFVPMVPGPRK